MNRVAMIACSFAAAFAAVCGAAQPVRGDDLAQRLQGRWDNRAQVDAQPQGSALPHVVVTIEPTPQKDFALWRVHVQTDPDATFDQTWAMQTRIEHDGSGALIPYYQLHQDQSPAAAGFDPARWLSVEACALRGNFAGKRIEAMAEGEPCVAVSMSIGARRALLPVGIVSDGDALSVDLNLRGVRTRIEGRRIR